MGQTSMETYRICCTRPQACSDIQERNHQRAVAAFGRCPIIRSTYYFTDYGRPEWWWNYPGYWDAPYWGNWGGWYYPYAVNYSYSTGSFISELLNLEAPQGQSEKLPVLWTSYMSGLLSGSTSVNTKLAVQGVRLPCRRRFPIRRRSRSNEQSSHPCSRKRLGKRESLLPDGRMYPPNGQKMCLTP